MREIEKQQSSRTLMVSCVILKVKSLQEREVFMLERDREQPELVVHQHGHDASYFHVSMDMIDMM